ncbi:MAG: hypothetical protein F4011_03840 [Acidimicrobiaceae bacterium]|nr:hypothetical protein [Acidimicrobiaceae bacterium]MYL03299.1 hypothetical protein [Acidimicrobiaceae bacterium]
MTEADVHDEAAPAGRVRFRRRGKARSPEASAPETGAPEADGSVSGQPAEPDAARESSPRAARAKKTRRQMSAGVKRFLLIVAGLLVLVASVLGFYMTSDAFDERVLVLVAARDIGDGDTVSAADFGSAPVLLDPSVPHVPWTESAPFFFEGMVAVQPIPAGSLAFFEMVREPESGAEGSELEVIIPLDLVMATQGVSDGEEVLLVDPGQPASEVDPGRPRQVVRSFRLTNFEGSQMRLFLPPEPWAEWEALLEAVGGTLMVVPLGDGGDPDEMTQRLDAVWQAQWSADVEAIAQAASEAEAEAEEVAGPGELEVIVSLDTSLVPSGVYEGDLVLVIDPGAEPLGNDPGRPRRVIDTLRLENYAAGQMRMFLPPEEWQHWRSLPDELGGTPMVLPVPAGSDIDDMSARLEAAWQAAWQQSVTEAGTAQ